MLCTSNMSKFYWNIKEIIGGSDALHFKHVKILLEHQGE